jgi:hypothetical protein
MGENKMVRITITSSILAFKRSYQEFGGTVHTLVWDDSDYLGEVTA